MSPDRAGSPAATVARVARLTLSRPTWLDVAFVVLSVVLMHAEVPLNPKAEPSALGSVAIVVAALPLLLRSRAPVVAFVLCFATMYGVIATVSVYNTMPLPAVLCAYALAERHGLRAAVLTGATALPVVLLILQLSSPHPVISWGTAQNLALVPLPLALGVAAHARRGYTSALIERAEAAERGREAEALRRVDEERLRIARDVHDVVAHAMVTINVQAGVGAHLLDRDPRQAYDTLRSIKQVSGDALTDLRAMLGVLREESGGTPAPPVQRLSDLGDLRETLLAAGVDVTFDLDDAVRALPAAVDATCFRVVQEALTNTLRHAGSTTARVRLARADDRVLLEVVDDGGTPVAPLRDSGGGHGLQGMRERVTALGGTLEAGPRAGGWRVAATLPLGTAPDPVSYGDVEVPAS